jgi:hypothetical protein
MDALKQFRGLCTPSRPELASLRLTIWASCGMLQNKGQLTIGPRES